MHASNANSTQAHSSCSYKEPVSSNTPALLQPAAQQAAATLQIFQSDYVGIHVNLHLALSVQAIRKARAVMMKQSCLGNTLSVSMSGHPAFVLAFSNILGPKLNV